MRDKYYPPKYNQTKFHCPSCNVFSNQVWKDLFIDNSPRAAIRCSFRGAYCAHCEEWSFWYEERLLVPSVSSVESPHPDLPSDCLSDYNEARDIAARSPRGAVALLRLVVQKLMVCLGESGKNINDDIKSLVLKGLPVLVQRALDVCRVIGNNAVHPGELDICDTPEIAYELFGIINFIVDDRITRPKEIETLYDKLPQNAKDAIDKRDAKS